MDLRRSKYANYRYSSYMQEGVAVLKIGSDCKSAKLTADDKTGRNNNIYPRKLQVVTNSRKNVPDRSNDSATEERTRLLRNKQLHADQAIRTTKCYIGKSCYNVGHYFDLLIAIVSQRKSRAPV